MLVLQYRVSVSDWLHVSRLWWDGPHVHQEQPPVPGVLLVSVRLGHVLRGHLAPLLPLPDQRPRAVIQSSIRSVLMLS